MHDARLTCSSHTAARIKLTETLYNNYVNAASSRLDEPAVYINETDELYTARQILNLTDRACDALLRVGVKRGSKVGVMSLGESIDEAVLLLALSKLGAVSKWVDFMKSPVAIGHSVVGLDCLVIDGCFIELAAHLNLDAVPTIVVNERRYAVRPPFLSYDALCADTCPMPGAAAYVYDRAAVIINSSGTTGEPKPIVHTDHSVNAAVLKMLSTDYPIGRGNVLIKMIPAQIGLGLLTSLYTGLISGALVVMIGVKEPPALIAELCAFIKDFKHFCEKNHLPDNAQLNLFSTPLFISGMVESPDVNDLSFIGSMLAAGSKMTASHLEHLEKTARGKGCTVPICNGYGQNEMAGAVTLNLNGKNVNGSAGLLTEGTHILIVDPNTKKPVAGHEIGLILEDCDSHFKEYDNMPEQTADAWLDLPDGSRWYNSRDLGYFDENGFLYITGRTSRVAIRTDFKISLDDIEEKLKSLPSVQDCAAVVPETGGSVERIVAFVQCGVDIGTLKAEIDSRGILSEFEMPSEFVLVDHMPYKSVGKIDYRALQKKSKEDAHHA